MNSPFDKYSGRELRDALQYQINKVFRSGNIETRFSCHSIRHWFAMREYEKDKDIVRLQEKLQHCSVAVTEVYLKNLKS